LGPPARPSREPDTVIEDVTERSITATIDREAALVSFVVVDLEGTASRMIPYAMSQADLVIIPSRGSTLDAVEAVAAIREVREQEAAFRVKIPAAILLIHRLSRFFVESGRGSAAETIRISCHRAPESCLGM
jgi:hypothetical protein